MTNTSYCALGSIYHSSQPAELRECINSLKSQTLQPQQVIIVIDGPVANALYDVLIECTKGLPIFILPKDSCTGLAASLNLAFPFISTKYILRIDTDDINLPSRANTLINIAESSDLDLVGSHIREFIDDKQGKIFLKTRKVPLTASSIRACLPLRNPFNHPSVLIKTEKLLEIGGYPTIRYLEDYALWALFITNNYKCRNVDQVLVYMRSNGVLERRALVQKQDLLKLKSIILKSGIYKILFIEVVFALKELSLRLPQKFLAFIYSHFLRRV